MISRSLFPRVLLCLSLLTPLAGVAFADEVASLKTAQRLAASRDWTGALAAAPAGVGRDLVLWQQLRAGTGSLGEYEDFLARRPDWPGLPLLKEKGEEAVARSTTPSRIIGYFGKDLPQTAKGAISLVAALQANGQRDLAETEAMRAWVDLEFTAEEEAALLSLAPDAVARVHQLRLDTLLWAGRRAEALRMLPRVSADWQRLAAARIGLRADQSGTTALIDAVPTALKADPGLNYERFLWRMRRDAYDDAVQLLLDTPAENLGKPELWADRRALMARWLMRNSRPQDAYRVAARHGLTSGSGFADLEFVAGFIALRKLNDAATAQKHFAALKAGVSTPISLSRAEYWLGRAAEAQNKAETANQHYKAAARHQTAYYGLLAAEKLGLSLDAALLDTSRPSDWRQAGFAKSSVLQAALLLQKAGDLALSKRFFLQVGESLDATGLAQLADLALELDEPHIAVLIGKAAAERGIILPSAYYPVPGMVPDGLAVSRALALAISRRESEFDPAARSHADARGLMQVLPGTAQIVAKELGLDYEAGKLISDPAFNVIMGAGYLAKMVDQFGPSIALVASGYNAGPNRPKRWIEEFGDPRLANTDVVDWVETVPFAETRTYVMRVVEGVVIYRAKLKGQVGPVRITSELKG
ncbi:lytic transglycosylase domain-containing protein [Xinfangfangia sp. CPCC 101601]|uniref:Lytic transglycosylase domain-containing protein n=1 Tax=Pseudogemmobacter lacusdianii TaxID=3069608 RepID=A0ABU0VYL2_9RHOB|nr:lytic transglycosylase domain-containing protein [Xinfangfangia sp. CPCC 101601]MDQ2066852.1 lytic transglycosylase domain-containing protein [Xinfangfangia sp. CPCC 101601]